MSVLLPLLIVALIFGLLIAEAKHQGPAFRMDEYLAAQRSAYAEYNDYIVAFVERIKPELDKLSAAFSDLAVEISVNVTPALQRLADVLKEHADD